MKPAFAALLSFTLALGACQAGSQHPQQWERFELSAPSENVLWAVSAQELQRVGFPVGTDADPSTLTMTSGWAMHLAPFRGDGYREQAQLRFERVKTDRWSLEVRVARENNMDIRRPTDPSSAQWEAAPDNVERAKVILQRIRARLGDALELRHSVKPRP